MLVPSTVGRATQARGYARDVKSREASRVLSELMGLSPAVRDELLEGTTEQEWMQLLMASQRDLGSPYGLWHDAPSSFCRWVLDETIWSKQREAIDSLVDHKSVVVPAGFGVGKTHIAARAVAWFSCTQPVGTALTVTIATRLRQVQRQLWPHIRRIHARAELPGDCDTIQWSMPDPKGVRTQVAYGFATQAYDEASMQGIHAVALLLVVDEAGGIATSVGRGTRNLLTGNARMLSIGNPSMVDEQTWFESEVLRGEDPDYPHIKTIRIPADASPSVTGEKVGKCSECPKTIPVHPLSDHLVDQAWIDDAYAAYDISDPFITAKVKADFPKGGTRRAIPSGWVDSAASLEAPEDAFPIKSLGLRDELSEMLVRRQAWVRLGVDVAADGGDEFVIARTVGDVTEIVHSSAGAENENPVQVAGKVLEHIRKAEQLRVALGSPAKVRVKLDGIGVGWGVVGLLKQWEKEAVHNAEIVSVVVSEKPERESDSALFRPKNKRAEMWLAGRFLLQPDSVTGEGQMRLSHLDSKTRGQLSAPQYEEDSGGFTVIERKDRLKKRGLRSPDRAEAILLSWYEPQPPIRRGRILSI